MSSLLLGSISATLGLDSSNYTRGLLNAQAVTSTFGSAITTFLTNPVLGAISALRGLEKQVRENTLKYVDQAEALEKLAQQAKFAVETIQGVQIAMQDAGKGSEVADLGIRSLTQRLGDAKKDGGALVKTFEDLGVSLSENDSPEVAFRKIIDAMANTHDEARRMALATEAFGRQAGPEFAVLFQRGSKELDAFIAKQQKIGNIFSREQVDVLLRADASVDMLKNLEEAAKKTQALAAARGALNDALDEDKLQRIADVMNQSAVGTEKAAAAYRKLADDAGRAVDAMTKLDSKSGWNQLLGVFNWSPSGNEEVQSALNSMLRQPRQASGGGSAGDLRTELRK